MRRAEKAGVSLNYKPLAMRHDNSSTIESGYKEKNAKTYLANQKYYQTKLQNDDFTSGQ
jgi:hypothetical protein